MDQVERNTECQGTIESNDHLGFLGRGVWWQRGGVDRKGRETILGMGWVLGRRMKLEYGSEANGQGGVSVKGI
jgi:hypothetical protein